MEAPRTLLAVAEAMMFRGLSESDILVHFEYRKGKTIEDLKKCRMKGSKLAGFRTEREPECIAIYLKSVLKKRRVTKADKIDGEVAAG